MTSPQRTKELCLHAEKGTSSKIESSRSLCQISLILSDWKRGELNRKKNLSETQKVLVSSNIDIYVEQVSCGGDQTHMSFQNLILNTTVFKKSSTVFDILAYYEKKVLRNLF